MDSATDTNTQTRPALSEAPRRRRRQPSWNYSTSNTALASGIDALKALHVDFERIFDAHTAADVARGAALQRFGTPRPKYNGMACANAEPDPAPPEYAAAIKACDRAERGQVRARDRVDRAAKALLKIEVHTVADALLKGSAYAWAMGSKDTASLPFEDDIALVLAALKRDVAKIGALPPSPAPSPPARGPDAAVEAYRAARATSAAYAHGLGEADADDMPTATAMLHAEPLDMAGVAARLGRIVSEAFLTRSGDWDCPLCLDKREAIIPPTSEELCAAGQGDNGGEDALFRALANLHLQVERLADDYDPVKAMVAHEWEVARDATYAARDASNGDYEPEEEDALFDRYADALEAWETLTPPSLEAMVEVMRASLDFNGLSRAWHGVDCPRTMRDFLDGGDTHTIFAARYYMHALRMTGSTSPALLTPPIAGLFPAYVEKPCVPITHEAQLAAWEEYHRVSDPYSTRAGELGRWQAPELEAIVSDPGALQQLWHYSRAISAEAARIVEDYEAMGGRFSLIPQADGRVFFGTSYPQDHQSPRREEIEFLTTHRKSLCRAVGDIVAKRDGIMGGGAAEQAA